MASLHTDNLTQRGQAFLDLLHAAGNPANDTFTAQIPQICARKCTKIVGRETIFEDRQFFAPQLLDARKRFGTWELKPELTKIDPAQDTVTVHYHVVTETQKHLDCMAVLGFKSPNAHGIRKVKEINEVFSEAHAQKCPCLEPKKPVYG